ncbi:Baseplate J-like protein [compost metagenome]
MAGVTLTGFEIKRFPEIVTDLKTDAQTVFQDLVPSGDSVDTGDSSTIGRFIALHSPQFSDLWELAQQVYAAFDPNSATGIALDNLVALNGTVRNVASPTSVDVVTWGDNGISIPPGTELRAMNGDNYTIPVDFHFTTEDNIGFVVTLTTVVVGQEYTLAITRGNTTTNLLYEALAGDTPDTVLSYFYSQISTNPLFASSYGSGQLRIESESIYVPLVVFTNLEPLKIKVRVEAVNQVNGDLPLSANTLTQISTPILGWDSVNNPFAGVPGGDEETDEELRIRFSLNKYISAVNINESLYSALVNIPGVQEVRIVENNTGLYDPIYDLPGHSFKPIVLGGDVDSIGAAVWLNQPLGIGSEGNTTVEVIDSQGFPHEIKFERPAAVPIYIDLEIESTGSMTAGAEASIKASLVRYFSNMRLGEEVVYSRLFTPINETPGFQVNSLTIGTDPLVMGMTNITLAYNQYATIDTANIDITVV